MQISMRHGVFWMALSQGSLFVVQFGGSVVIARLITPYEMGVYAIAMAMVGLLSIVRVCGLSVFLIREPDLAPETITSAFTINAILCAIAAGATAGLSGICAAWLGEPGVRSVMTWLAVLPLLYILEFRPNSMLERAGAFRIVAILGSIKVVINVAVTILLAVCGFSYMSIAYGSIAGTAAAAACSNILAWSHVSFRVSLHDWRRLSQFGLHMFAISCVGSVASRLSEVLLGRLVGLGGLGLYSRASGLHSLLWDNLHQVVARIVFVDFAEQRRHGRSLHDTYLRVMAIMTALLWPAFTGLSILAGPVIITVYGPTWIDAAVPLSLLALSGVVLVSNTMVSEVYIVSDQTRRQVRFEAKRSIAGLLLFVLGCIGGLAWAAAARFGEAVLGVLFCKRDLLRMTNSRLGEHAAIYWQSGRLTLLACGPSTALMWVNQWSPDTPLPAIGVAVLAGVTAWAVGLWLLKHPLYDELQVIARHVLGPMRRA